MNLHEYQAKELLRSYRVPVLAGYLAYTPREAQKAAINLGTDVVVVKAQVHAGGRGKAGGVKIAKSPDEAYQVASKILGMKLVSPQTGPQGRLVQKVWVEQGIGIKQEYYLSLIIDRDSKSVAIIVSPEGGVEIEEVAAKSPEKVLRVAVAPQMGFQDLHARKIAEFLKLDKAQAADFSGVIRNLYTAFLALDCSMLEINPLILTNENKFVCLDAKVAIDDNALFRQPVAYGYMDYDEIDEKELVASQVGISYVAMEGNIGCMVNGAGLAMGTMDIIKQAGGEPANFLDVGGGANAKMVTQAFKLILSDSNVKAVLVNIFGGIMKCDVIAEGIIEAAKSLSIAVPIVVRLEGTNVARAKEMLQQSGLKLTPADDMADAAKKVVAAAKGK